MPPSDISSNTEQEQQQCCDKNRTFCFHFQEEMPLLLPVLCSLCGVFSCRETAAVQDARFCFSSITAADLVHSNCDSFLLHLSVSFRERNVREFTIVSSSTSSFSSSASASALSYRFANCSKVSTSKLVCSKCTSVSYCCKQCQIDHWPKHKEHCMLVSCFFCFALFSSILLFLF